jgi:protocatechuate 3,4-dioxygenase beta subunit
MRPSRRRFLVSAAALVGAQPVAAGRPQGLDAFAADTLPCVLDVQATPAVSPDAAYRAGAPERTSLVSPGEGGIPLALTGTVAGLSCGPIPGARVEFWQPDRHGAFAPGFPLRGWQRTDARGRYHLTTIMPGAPASQAPYIGVHVVVEKRAELWTALFFPGEPANARDQRVVDALMVKLAGTPQSRTATFDIRLNL